MGWISQKTISRYCPFKSALSEIPGWLTAMRPCRQTDEGANKRQRHHQVLLRLPDHGHPGQAGDQGGEGGGGALEGGELGVPRPTGGEAGAEV
jgi:hypothetical protein